MSSKYSSILALALVAPAATLAAPAATRAFKYPTALKIDNRPLPSGEKAAVVHAPYGAGDCSICTRAPIRGAPAPC